MKETLLLKAAQESRDVIAKDNDIMCTLHKKAMEKRIMMACSVSHQSSIGVLEEEEGDGVMKE